jgi:dephospho-CoA kinase
MLHCRSMKRSTLVTGLVILLVITATCDNSERMARLEKRDQELQAEVSKSHASANYDLQAKCSKRCAELVKRKL